MKHFLEQYYIEPDLIKKLEVEEDDELSDDEKVTILSQLKTEKKQIQLRLASQATTAKQIHRVVKADERNDDDQMSATVVDEQNNVNQK